MALIEGLPRDRFEPHIICLSGFGALEQRARASGAVLHDLSYPRLRTDGRLLLHRLPAVPLAVGRLVSLLRQIRPDVLHTMIPVCNVLGAFAGTMASVPRIVCTKLALGVYRDNARALRWLEDRAAPRYALVHCKSHGILEDVAAREPIPRSRLRVIYNGLRTEPYGLPANRAAVLGEFGIHADAFVFGMVANLIPYKGHAEVIEAAPAVLREFPDVRFLFVGRDDGIREKLARQAQELGVAHAVTFAGERHDVPQLLSSLDTLVSASHEEGFSNVLLEAMASRLPVVATRVGGNPEAVEDGVTGVLVPARNPGALAAAMLGMRSDPDVASSMGRLGLERVRRLFSYEAMINGMLQFYDEVLQSSGVHPHNAEGEP